MSARSRDPRLAAYTVLKAVGKGSYGEVFLAKNGKDRKQVCCQVASRVAASWVYYCICLSCMQYVIKNIKLTASSAKERLAAEQEVGACSIPSVVLALSPLTSPAGLSVVQAAAPQHCIVQRVLHR